MRYAREYKAQTHRRILDEAARRFRAEGIDAVGVVSLMDSVGLTHGGFYAHFPSKDALVAEVCRGAQEGHLLALKTAVDAAPAGRKLVTLAERYLCAPHRDHPGEGCYVAALAVEVSRKPGIVQDAMTRLIGAMVALAAECAAADGCRVSGETIVGMLVGTLTLARTVNDPALSESFLASGRKAIETLVQEASATPG